MTDELDDVPGRWVAHVEGKTRVVDQSHGPFDSDEEAVRWARERADRVRIRLPGENFYRSAGVEPEPGRPRWPRTPEEAKAAAEAAAASTGLRAGVLTLELHPPDYDTILDSDPVAEAVEQALVEGGFADVTLHPREDPEDLARPERWTRSSRPGGIGISSAVPWSLTATVDGLEQAERVVELAREALTIATGRPARAARARPGSVVWWRDLEQGRWSVIAGHGTT
jgi:hypothetical protein